MRPLLSIVTGTYQRLDYLRAMVKSVREQLPHGFPYEFVIVDGGSTDGTPAWCEAQSDVVFIQQGQLLGAIRAFDAGCEAAKGEFVGLFNDDVLVFDGAITKALYHLITRPNCGAVAFADDRPAPGYNTTDFKVQHIRAMTPEGRQVDVVYAQCGLYRRWLGDLCNWWDMGDPQQHTYGADAHLSAQIWMRGYTVDAVEGVQVKDRIAPDELRQINSNVEQQRGSAYYRKYPNGVYLNSLPKPEAPEQLRVLYLPLFSPGYGRYKTGLYDALAKVGTVYELDYHQHRAHLATAVSTFQPHLVISQFHDTNAVDASVLEHLRELAPGAVWVNWMGDVWMEALTAPGMLALLKHVDLQLVVNAEALPVYAEQGIQAAYWQIAAESTSDPLPETSAHTLLFMGNAYSPERKQLGAVLRELDPAAGLYGWGWENASGDTLYNFNVGASLYRNCQIAIGDNQYRDKGFVSNRFFEATAHGAFLLHQAIPGMEELTGFVDGVHYVSWTDFDDLKAKVRHYLKHAAERTAIAAAGQAFANAQHTFDARVKTLFETLLPRLAHDRPAPAATHDDAPAMADMAYMEHMATWHDGIPR